MIIRFRTRDGMQRISCESTEAFDTVLKKLLPKLSGNIDLSSLLVGSKEGQANEPVGELLNRSVADLGLSHGDIVFLDYKELETGKAESRVDPAATVATGSVGVTTANESKPLQVTELSVDVELEKIDGLIPRSRSELCRHGDGAMCEYCCPLPPWDRGYHEQQNIKHISFHSYLKELDDSTNKGNGSSYIAPLSQPDFKIDKNCRNGHEPWPKGICSKCQPSAITLQQQQFRMIDHVEFEQSDLINEFIESWRFTGTQRFGYMYGTYRRYDATPLGIKAVVKTIYEPSQHDEQDGLTMDFDVLQEEMAKVDAVAESIGLTKIGLIFTDLTDCGFGDGSVICKRHKDSFFLSSLEIIMAAKHQLKNPNVCKFSEQGIFSSKFVTCVISGNLQNEIDIAAYQVSTSAEALVDADMISGSTHPSMAYINETNQNRYVPEIFYMRKNEYGVTIKENAKPAFPVDYLLVSLTHGFPKTVSHSPGFTWANRQAMGKSQDYHELKDYLLEPAVSADFTLLQKKLADLQLQLYLHSLDILSPQEWSLLVEATRVIADASSSASASASASSIALPSAATSSADTASSQQQQEALLQLVSSPGWQTLIMILQSS